ncbi:MAG TPA: Snf7 family protein [Nitrosopumilaceae archaeon]|jgi:division protein CdvB (Snf7/Vps24/ESCRT-III family)|nr:Snf7 family protein [Nitrosopumilaceae archaeon]
MPGFDKKWTKPPTPTFGERINDAIRPKGSLKPRMELAVRKLQNQISKLDGMITKLKQRDEKLFKRIVVATQQHDFTTSKVLSKELAEVRKVTKLLGNARMALEQIELRLSTFHDLGDTVVTIMPTIGLMRSLRSSLVKFMPEADHELGSMTEMLNGLMTDTFHSGDFGIDSEATSEESEKILQEAAAVAEAAVNDKLPSMPAGQSSSARYI